MRAVRCRRVKACARLACLSCVRNGHTHASSTVLLIVIHRPSLSVLGVRRRDDDSRSAPRRALRRSGLPLLSLSLSPRFSAPLFACVHSCALRRASCPSAAHVSVRRVAWLECLDGFKWIGVACVAARLAGTSAVLLESIRTRRWSKSCAARRGAARRGGASIIAVARARARGTRWLLLPLFYTVYCSSILLVHLSSTRTPVAVACAALRCLCVRRACTRTAAPD